MTPKWNKRGKMSPSDTKIVFFKCIHIKVDVAVIYSLYLFFLLCPHTVWQNNSAAVTQ